MNYLLIVLRIFHFLFGVTWVGGTIFMGSVIAPTAGALGDDAKGFMQHLMLKSQFGPLMFWASTITVFSGLWMYLDRFDYSIDISSGSGLALTIGGLLGIASWMGGYYYLKRSLNGLHTVSSEIVAAGGPPKPEQLAMIAAYQDTIAKASPIITILAVLALVFMSLSENFAI